MKADRYLIDGDPEKGPYFIMAHGAGAPMDSAWMNRFARGLVARGVGVVRFEFPYMHGRRTTGTRRGPDRSPVLERAWLEAVADWRPCGQPFIGGKSMGGRIASMVADAAEVAGLICLGYPFHPPGRPDKLRTAHLRTLRTPGLILQGTRDPFGVPDEVEGYALSPAIEMRWLDDGDHSFKPRVKSGRTHEQNFEQALDAAAGFLLGR